MNATAPIAVRFRSGQAGPWRVCDVVHRVGCVLPVAERLDMREGRAAPPEGAMVWELRGVTSHTRYTTATEARALARAQPPLGRPEATCAALIPIRKNDAWWALAQDERRAIYEERSRHTSIGLEYLPHIASRLHYCRDLGEPFDFLAWFEFAPRHAGCFDDLLERMRATEEWRYVEREVEVRLER